MPTITKINKHLVGDFTVKFNTKNGHFLLEYPPGVGSSDKIPYNDIPLLTWEDVINEVDRVYQAFLAEEKLIRKVIIIQLKTSVSDKKILKKNGWKTLSGSSKEDFVYDENNDHLHYQEGFSINWFIAEEYELIGSFNRKELIYKVLETNKNNKVDSRINDLYRTVIGSCGEIRLLPYSEELHNFLKKLEVQITEMVTKLNEFFDLNPEKFLTNVMNNNNIKLLNN